MARARAYHAREVWEAALVSERLLARWPGGPHAEEAAAWRVRALAESRRPAAAIVEAESFAREHPRSPLRASTLGVAAGAAAGLGDGPRQVRLLAAALAADPAPDLRDVLRLRQAQAWIGVGAFTEAWSAATRLRTDSPDGPWREEARYLEAMASLAGGVAACPRRTRRLSPGISGKGDSARTLPIARLRPISESARSPRRSAGRRLG
jgi:hypothetical protein